MMTIMIMIMMVVMLLREYADSNDDDGDHDNEGDYDDAYYGSMKMCSWSKFPKKYPHIFLLFFFSKVYPGNGNLVTDVILDVWWKHRFTRHQ